MLTGANAEVHIVQYNAIAARHIDSAQFEKVYTRIPLSLIDTTLIAPHLLD